MLHHFNEEEIFDFTSNNFVRSEYFKFVAVAPLAFRFFRDFYGISYHSFQVSLWHSSGIRVDNSILTVTISMGSLFLFCSVPFQLEGVGCQAGSLMTSLLIMFEI